MSPLLERRFWVFDMDGTLTVPTHDFDALRRDLGLPPDSPILETLDALPPEEAAVLHERLHAWELEHAARALPIADAVALLEVLASRGATLGVLTRNTRPVALRTLEVTGLADYFVPSDVLGRDSAAPKPSPEGVLRLLTGWSAEPAQAVMVGDWVFDVDAGRAAGAATVWIDRHGHAPRFPGRADVVVSSLRQLLS